MRIGSGWDLHSLEINRPLILGGVEIEDSPRGAVAHSDGDALIHAMIDALLGAAGLEDIGTYFPDTDPTYKDIDSRVLLRMTNDLVREKDYDIVNFDTTIVLQSPKLSKYIPLMKEALAEALDLDPSCIGIKAKTAEHILGELGESKAVMTFATVLLEER
ncbi:MAG: 2-C-methyl-D-erythritol 2,4-cyclodiphosphate synthase [Sphaerochaetaceae bacterium]|nr:2-C-methyl-D-erythritol 2,4-cyclodiphosphate synthase [Sphaerochaetaceae bacterium]